MNVPATVTYRACAAGAVFALGLFAGWAWAQQPDVRLEVLTQESVRKELVDHLQRQFAQVEELNRKGAVGGENESLSLLKCHLLWAKAELAAARGNRQQQQTMLGEAGVAAHRNVDYCESAYSTQRIPLERLVGAYELAAKVDLALVQLAEGLDPSSKPAEK